MSKSNKQKKAEANAARAKQQKGSQEKPSTKTPETTPKAVKSSDWIIGYNSRVIGSVVHAVTADGSMLCNKKVLLEPGIWKDPTEVTCCKCWDRRVIKDLVLEVKAADRKAFVVKKKPPEKTAAEEKAFIKKIHDKAGLQKKTTPQQVDDKKALEPKPKLDINKPKPLDSKEDFLTREDVNTILKVRFALMTKKFIKVLSEMVSEQVQDIVSGRPDFFVVSKSNGKYSIIHEPSRYVIADNMSAESAEELLTEYIKIPEKWDGKAKPTKTWMTAITSIYENFVGPVGDAEVKLKTRRKEKQSSLSIRRHSKKTTTKLKVRRRGR